MAAQLWMQNAGFVWVPFIIAATIAAFLGMNDIADAKASFREQAIIFQRKHNWLMCVLYTGTFGSFIGYSAGFPLLAKTQFPDVNSLQFVFLGPLVGALSRAATGWISDRFGGGRVTFWTFAGMIAAVFGVIFFLGIKEQPGAFWGFFACFMALFFLTGIGNASTFQMIPVDHGARDPAADAAAGRRGAPPAGRPRERGDHRLHQRDRGLWRLLHPEGLRHLDRADRHAGLGALGASSAFYAVCLGADLGVLHPAGRPSPRHRARPGTAGRRPANRLIGRAR